MIKRYIKTHHVYPPIPDRRFDWSAVTDDYEPGSPHGEGPTEWAAIADLMEELHMMTDDEKAAAVFRGAGAIAAAFAVAGVEGKTDSDFAKPLVDAEMDVRALVDFAVEQALHHRK